MANEDVSRRNSPEATGLAENTPVLSQPSRLLNPSFRAEDQAMAQQLDQQSNVIGPPAFASPDPVTNQGRLVPVDQHALGKAGLLADDYGASVGGIPVEGPQEPLGNQEVDPYLVQRDETGTRTTADLPADREEWSKSDWQTYAASVGVGTSGSAKAIQDRVDKYEEAQRERATFTSEVNGASRDDLDTLAESYGLDPATYSNKELLAQAVIASEYDEDVPPGDKSTSGS